MPAKVSWHEYSANLINLPICEYDIILDMDWLFREQAQLNCYTWEVILLGLTSPNSNNDVNNKRSLKIVSASQARKIIKLKTRILSIYLKQTKRAVSEIPIVREFPEVFPEKISSLPPDRDIEFTLMVFLPFRFFKEEFGVFGEFSSSVHSLSLHYTTF